MNEGYVIAVDPGVTAGCCVFYYHGGHNYDVVDSFLIPWDSRYEMMQDLFLFTPIAALVYEKFVLYPESAEGQAFSEFETVQSLEIFRTFAWVNGLYHLLVPLPASVKGSSKTKKNIEVKIRPQDDARLNRSNYEYRRWQHIKDSYQLGRYYITQQMNRSSR